MIGTSRKLLPKPREISGGGILRGHFEPDFFKDIITADNLFLAWEKFRRGKRSKMDVQIFERRLEENIFALQYQLENGSYKHSRYRPFTITDPKQRQIHKATVRDRVVHQAMVQEIEPLFEQRFIYDSFSCRKGKGTHAAVARLRMQLRRASRNNSRTVYSLKLDIRKFFASVDHGILLRLLEKRVSDARTIGLLKGIVDSHGAGFGRSIPLGNLTSQLFANVYLHELDWYVKQDLGVEHYIRYCDDFIILSHSRKHLAGLVGVLEDFLNAHLRLAIHPYKIVVRTWEQGVDFLGYVLKPGCTLLRTRTKQRMVRQVSRRNLASYLGVCSHAASFETQQLIRNMVRPDNDLEDSALL